jgi:peptide/nickel transport system permease protein
LLIAQTFAVLLAVPWALWAASRAKGPVDKCSTLATFLMLSIPEFALGVILKYVFAIKLSWLPQSYVADGSLWSRFEGMILPSLTIAIPTAAIYQRLLRSDLITTLQEDFILMARSKGVPRNAILFRHALRPSLFSFVTVFGLNTGTLIGGSLIAEQIFNVPGLGAAVVESVAREDFPVVLAIVMLIAVTFVLLNLLIDVAYSVIDPRVKR